MKKYIISSDDNLSQRNRNELPEYFVWDNSGYFNRYSVHIDNTGICISKISAYNEAQYVYAWWYRDGDIKYYRNFGGMFVNRSDIRVVQTDYEKFDLNDIDNIYEVIDYICYTLIELNKNIEFKKASPY